MYLKFDCRLELRAIGKRLIPEAVTDEIETDAENVYEWMWIEIPNVPCSLNVSREHGWAQIEDALMDLDSDAAEDEVHSIVTPGPVFVSGWNRSRDEFVDALPDWLSQYFADRLSIDVLVFHGRPNVDLPDTTPIAVVHPHVR